jgi:hypothetical protein
MWQIIITGCIIAAAGIAAAVMIYRKMTRPKKADPCDACSADCTDCAVKKIDALKKKT